MKNTIPIHKWFQHTAARRRLEQYVLIGVGVGGSFNTQPPEGGWTILHLGDFTDNRFNTQPPEGGWMVFIQFAHHSSCFNTQPPEGGWFFKCQIVLFIYQFQHTAARRRLANWLN